MIPDHENGSDRPDDPFDNFINNELHLDDEYNDDYRHYGMTVLTASEYEALRRGFREQLNVDVAKLVQESDARAWEEDLEDLQQDMIDVITECVSQALSKQHAGRMTEGEWRHVVRYVTTLAYYLDEHRPLFLPA